MLKNLDLEELDKKMGTYGLTEIQVDGFLRLQQIAQSGKHLTIKIVHMQPNEINNTSINPTNFENNKLGLHTCNLLLQTSLLDSFLCWLEKLATRT